MTDIRAGREPTFDCSTSILNSLDISTLADIISAMRWEIPDLPNAHEHPRTAFPLPPTQADSQNVWRMHDYLARLDTIAPLDISAQPTEHIPPSPPAVFGRGAMFRAYRTNTEQQQPPPPSCRICYDEDKPDNLLKLPCTRGQTCYYCSPCLTKLFELAMKDEMHYPPRCHRRKISLNTARRYLPKSLVRQYQLKSLELSTKNKVYCSKISCNAFVAPHSIHNGLAHCQKCQAKTCVECKEVEHFGPCDGAAGLLVLQTLAKEQKWQTCPDCKKIVEKVDGCPHILCRCGCDFCYECGDHLEKCQCTGDEEGEYDDDEDRLPPRILRDERRRTRELEEDIIEDTLIPPISRDWED